VNEGVYEKLSEEINSKNVFPYDSDNLYYYVREAYLCDSK
jgi:hypothetical protein